MSVTGHKKTHSLEEVEPNDTTGKNASKKDNNMVMVWIMNNTVAPTAAKI